LHENEISGIIIDCCIKVHRNLGPGLLESVYEEALCYELSQKGLSFQRQKEFPVAYENIKLEMGFRADVIVEEKVIVEIKSVENIIPVYKKKLLTYLRLTGLKLGLLINFNVNLLKDGITRVVDKLPE
jgi:GxxExxY protein